MKMLILSFFFVSLAAFASDLPPGHIFQKECKTQDHVTICALNQHHGHPQLTIQYGFPHDVDVWIRLNGREGRFPIEGQVLLLNHFRSVHRCLNRAEVAPNDYPKCPEDFVRRYNAQSQTFLWFFEPPRSNEAELFFYARDNSNRANRWDIEVAFVDRWGQWDSRNGQNYRFTFHP